MKSSLTTRILVVGSLLLLGSVASAPAQAAQGRDLGEVTVSVLPAAIEPEIEPAIEPDREPDTNIEPRAVRPETDEPSREPAEAAVPEASGDCDRDGLLTVADAQCALDMSSGLRVQDLNVDLDQDGIVTSADARRVLQSAVTGR